MRDGLREQLRGAHDDDDVRAIVLTGSGRAFCSGGDMGSGLVSTPAEWLDFYAEVYSLLDYMHTYPKPIVGAINGLCYAAGLILAKYCDFVIASETASFCYIEARAGMGGIGTAIHSVGPQWAKFLILTGEEISAERAERIGLTLMTVKPEDLVETCVRIGERTAAMSPHVVALNKRHVNAELDALGWYASRDTSSLLYSVMNASLSRVSDSEGNPLFEILANEGLRGFIRARDREFKDRLLPW